MFIAQRVFISAVRQVTLDGITHSIPCHCEGSADQVLRKVHRLASAAIGAPAGCGRVSHQLLGHLDNEIGAPDNDAHSTVDVWVWSRPEHVHGLSGQQNHKTARCGAASRLMNDGVGRFADVATAIREYESAMSARMSAEKSVRTTEKMKLRLKYDMTGNARPESAICRSAAALGPSDGR